MALPAAALSPEDEIAFLLQRVESATHCTFYRNGSAHTAAEALTHMTRKYRHFARDIDSGEAFIDRAATRSLLTRRPYWVACDGQPRQRTADWLHSALKAYRADRG